MPATAYGFCKCGCGERTNLAPQTVNTIGWIKGEPLDYIRFHHSRKPQFRHTEDEKTGCWIWEGPISPDGYGKLRPRGTRASMGAHRFYYEIYIGKVPDGFQLDHLCRNRACVNPAHLEPVSAVENVRRGKVPKLDVKKAQEIRESEATGPELAQRFGVSRVTISLVRRGKIWK